MFPVDQWITDGKPMLGTKGWFKLAMKIASKDTRHLASIFEAGELLLSSL